MEQQFTFQPDFWAGGRTQSNPDGGLPDGAVVGRVNTRRNSGSDDFMAQLLQAIVQMQQSRETSAQRAAARRDPTAEANRLRQTPGTPEFNGMGPGGNQMVNGQLLGPITAGSGMTPEQIARMQGRTAMNQWRFPDMFRQIDKATVDGVVKEHNDGINFIRQQQAQEVPTTDFRQRDPNMTGRYEGTNVRDFLLDQAARKAQDKVDDFGPAPADAVRRIIPQAKYGATPGYATRPGYRLNLFGKDWSKEDEQLRKSLGV